MARKTLQVGVVALFGAAAAMLTPVIPASLLVSTAQAQDAGSGCGPNGSAQVCATNADRPSRMPQFAASALYAAEAFNRDRDYCSALKYADMARTRGNGDTRFEIGARASLALSRAYQGLADTEPKPDCVEGRSRERLLESARAALDVLPSDRGTGRNKKVSVYLQDFYFERAHVYGALGGDYNTRLKLESYDTFLRVSTDAQDSQRRAEARLALAADYNEFCRRARTSNSLSEIRATLQNLGESECLGDGYRRLAELGTDLNTRLTDYDSAVRVYLKVSTPPAVLGRTRLAWAALTPDAGQAARLRRDAIEDLTTASSASPANGDLKLALAQARASVAGRTPDPTIDQLFQAAIVAGANRAVALEARGDYAAATGRNVEALSYYREALSANPANPRSSLLISLASRDASLVPTDLLRQVARSASDPTARSEAYYALALISLKAGVSESARQDADSAVEAGGQPSAKYRALSCLALIASARQATNPLERLSGGRVVCGGGDTAEQYLVNGMYRLARLRLTAQNSAAENEEAAAAAAAFSAGRALAARTGDGRPTFAGLLDAGSTLTVEKLLKYGATRTVLCMNQNSQLPNGVSAEEFRAAGDFFSRVGAACS